MDGDQVEGPIARTRLGWSTWSTSGLGLIYLSLSGGQETDPISSLLSYESRETDLPPPPLASLRQRLGHSTPLVVELKEEDKDYPSYVYPHG